MKVEITYGQENLDKIARFRVFCYEHSPYSEKINFKNYPDGLTDELDHKSYHFLVYSAEKLIGSARLTLLNRLAEIPYIQEFDSVAEIDSEEPFWFYSRLAVDQSFRMNGVGRMLDESRFDFMESKKKSVREVWMIAKEWRVPQLIKLGCHVVQIQGQSPESVYPFSTLDDIYLLKASIEL
ncbi:MAG: GNAT family N-acetyltransferase [Cytophagia bacterium]|nr:GNAT family N-acetyltransferase [Cytophagia bacterium]